MYVKFITSFRRNGLLLANIPAGSWQYVGNVSAMGQ